jgi:tRNA-binding EMAP/Myf-like protein
VVVGQVVEVCPHPGGERIWLADVNVGTGMPRIIWGGVPIVARGSLVPVAQPGTWLPPTKGKPGPYKIRCRNYRGVRSEGMLCSLAELGWDSSVTDWVALLKDTAGLRVGDCLDNRFVDWETIVVPASEFLQGPEIVSIQPIEPDRVGWDLVGATGTGASGSLGAKVMQPTR